MSDQSGMSDDELESMLSDLENQEGSGDFEDEDVDGVLSELEQDLESSDAPQRDREEPDLETPELAAEAQDMDDELGDLDLDGLGGDDNLPVEGGEGAEVAADADNSPDPSSGESSNAGASTSKEQSQRAEQSSGTRADAASDPSSPQSTQEESTSSETAGEADDEPSRVLQWGLDALKWGGLALPSVALWWVVGAYLGQWVSAGWLITIVATAFVLGAPAALYQTADRFLENRGRFRWWLLGFGVVMTALLVAPMADAAGAALTQYGHWPAQTIAELTGLSAEGSLVGLNEWFGETVGGWLNAGAGDAMSLGGGGS